MRDPQEMRYGPGIVNVIERTTAAAGMPHCVDAAPLALQAGQTALVPQLHCQPNHRGGVDAHRGSIGIRNVFDEQGGGSGTIHASTHRHSNNHRN
jgi:hypothetical protein